MASQKNEIEYTFSVSDQGSSVVEEARRNLRGFETDAERVNQAFSRTSQSANQFSQTFSQTGRQVKLLAGDVASELNPALGGIVQRATQAGGAVQGMGAAFTIATAALVIASAAMTQYIRTLNDATERQARLNIAARSFDAGPIRGQLAEIAEHFEKVNQRSSTFFGRIANSLSAAGAYLGLSRDYAADRAYAQQSLAPVRQFESAVAGQEVRSKQIEGIQGFYAALSQQAQQRGDLAEIVRQNEKLLQLLSEQADVESRLLDLERQREVAGATVRNEGPEAIAAINRKYRGLELAIGDRFTGRITAQQIAGQNAYFQEFSQQLQRDVASSQGAYLEQALVGPTDVERQRGYEIGLQQQRESLDIQRQITDVLTQQAGLTKTEQAQRQLVAIEAERQLKVTQALNDADKERLANLEAQVRTQAVLQQELERVDATAGLAAGFRDVAEEVQSSGQRMRDSIVSTFHDINRSFGDIVIAGITGQGNKLSEIGRQFGLNMLRNFINEFSTRAVGSAFNAIGGYLPSARSVAGTVGAAAIAGSAIAPASVGAGTVLPYGAGAGIVTATGTIQPIRSTAGSFAYGQGGDTVATAGGGGGISLPITGLGALLPNSGGGGGFVSGFFGPSVSLYDAAVAYGTAGFEGVAAIQAGNAIIVNGELVFTGGAAYGGGAAAAGALEGGGAASVGASGASSAAGAGATVASIAGGVLAAAALAYGAYSAYQAGAAGDKYAALSGAASGAVSGAVLGSIIYPGIGTVVGAIAGAAIGAGAGGAGKSNQVQSHAQREARETKDVENSVSGFEAAVASAEDLDGLHDVLISYTHAAYGGGKPGVSPETAGFAFLYTFEDQQYIVGYRDAWGGRHPYLRLGDKSTFKAWGVGGDITTFKAAIQAGIGGKDAINGPATAIVQRKVQQLRDQELRGLIAYEEGFDAPGVQGTALTRLTVLPSSRYQEAAGKDLLISREQLLLAGFNDDMMEIFIRRMAKVDNDRQLGAINAQHLIF